MKTKTKMPKAMYGKTMMKKGGVKKMQKGGMSTLDKLATRAKATGIKAGEALFGTGAYRTAAQENILKNDANLAKNRANAAKVEANKRKVAANKDKVAINKIKTSAKKYTTYPNPAKAGDMITITVSKDILPLDTIDLNIVRSTGQLIDKHHWDNVQQGSLKFSAPEEPGVYILQLTTGDTSTDDTVKLMIQ